MFGLLANILPFAAGASVSPTLLIVQLRLTAGAQGSRATGAVFAAGCAVVLAAVTVTALALAAGTGGSESSPAAVGIVKLVLALILAAFGVQTLRKPRNGEAGRASERRPAESPTRAFVLGMVMMGTNFSSLTLLFPAIHEIGVAKAGDLARVAAGALLLLATMLPVLVPLLPANRAGRALQRASRRVHDAFGAHERGATAAITFFFALLLALQGAERLV